MPLPLTDAQLAELAARQTDAIWVDLLTITHPDLGTPVRLVVDSVDVVSRSNTYTAIAADVRKPERTSEGLSVAAVTFDHVDRSVLIALDGLEGPLTLTIEEVRLSDPDTVVRGPLSFKVRGYGVKTRTLGFRLRQAFVQDQPYPGLSFTPRRFPEMFRV